MSAAGAANRRVVLASGNTGKLAELSAILSPLGMTLLAQNQFEVPEVEETGLTFIENALLKARAAAAHSGLPAIADDSGLEVASLRGAPGICSARYAGVEGDRKQRDAANNRKLLAALAGLPEVRRRARFHCVMVYLRHASDPIPVVCQGSWEGFILEAERGAGGFGYDPLFYVPEYACSAAELERELKNRISHRARACAGLAAALQAER